MLFTVRLCTGVMKHMEIIVNSPFLFVCVCLRTNVSVQQVTFDAEPTYQPAHTF